MWEKISQSGLIASEFSIANSPKKNQKNPKNQQQQKNQTPETTGLNKNNWFLCCT